MTAFAHPTKTKVIKTDFVNASQIVTDFQIMIDPSNIVSKDTQAKNSSNEEKPKPEGSQDRGNERSRANINRIKSSISFDKFDDDSFTKLIESEKKSTENMMNHVFEKIAHQINEILEEVRNRINEIDEKAVVLEEKLNQCSEHFQNYNNSKFLFDDIDNLSAVVLSRQIKTIHDFLLNHAPNEVLQGDEKPDIETLIGLIPFLCKIYKNDQDTALLWAIPAISEIIVNRECNQNLIQKWKPILLEVRRVLGNGERNENNEINHIVEMKLKELC